MQLHINVLQLLLPGGATLSTPQPVDNFTLSLLISPSSSSLYQLTTLFKPFPRASHPLTCSSTPSCFSFCCQIVSRCSAIIACSGEMPDTFGGAGFMDGVYSLYNPV